MASFRPFPLPPPPPLQAPAPNQSPLPPPFPVQPLIGHRQPYPQQRNFLPTTASGSSPPLLLHTPISSAQLRPDHPSAQLWPDLLFHTPDPNQDFVAPFSRHRNQQLDPPPWPSYHPQQQHPYGPRFPLAPPLLSATYPPLPPPQSQLSMYYPSSRYTSQYNPPAQPPAPPPPLAVFPFPGSFPASPPSPPPLPPSSVLPQPPPPSNHSNQSTLAKEAPHPGRQPKPSIPLKQQKPYSGPPVAAPPEGEESGGGWV